MQVLLAVANRGSPAASLSHSTFAIDQLNRRGPALFANWLHLGVLSLNTFMQNRSAQKAKEALSVPRLLESGTELAAPPYVSPACDAMTERVSHPCHFLPINNVAMRMVGK